MTSIIILNWNGWEDTVACLDSLYKLQGTDFFIIIADNGSTDNSILYIEKWFNVNLKNFYLSNEDCDDVFPDRLSKGDCLLMAFSTNYGFAKGNNKAIDIGKRYNPDYYLLLNNDTEVQPDFLNKLENFIFLHNDYKALTPLIRYYGDKDKIWNCGGKLFAGFRRYFYADALISELKIKDFIPISFVTGCALFFDPILLDNQNRIFVERFFFGEEDFDFSMRMKKKKIKMACVCNSQIYHKVSSSTASFCNIGKIYIHYLNRFVDMKLHFGAFLFFLWKYFYSIYIIYFLRRKGMSLSKSFRFVCRLLNESAIRVTVDKSVFEDYVRNNILLDIDI